jgi:hypothetical protein
VPVRVVEAKREESKGEAKKSHIETEITFAHKLLEEAKEKKAAVVAELDAKIAAAKEYVREARLPQWEAEDLALVGRMLKHAQETKQKRILVHPSNTFKSGPSDAVQAVLDTYFHSEDVEIVYTCQGTHIYERNVTTNEWDACELDEIEYAEHVDDEGEVDSVTFFRPLYNDGETLPTDVAEGVTELGLNGDHKALRMQGNFYVSAVILELHEPTVMTE